MSIQPNELQEQANLRMLAQRRLDRSSGPDSAHLTASAAMGVLHSLATSPDSAADALALLHELQVHQVEIELQAEELRDARSLLEETLMRQVQLYDYAPAGFFTMDPDTTMHEVNLAGARLVDVPREALAGRKLETFMTPESGRMLRALLARIAQGGVERSCTLQLVASAAAPRGVLASAARDPGTGSRLLVALVPL